MSKNPPNGNWTSFKRLLIADRDVPSKSPGAILEIKSNDGAFLLNRMTTIDRSKITPENGMIIYNTDVQTFQFYANGKWIDFQGGGGTGGKTIKVGKGLSESSDASSITLDVMKPDSSAPGTAYTKATIVVDEYGKVISAKNGQPVSSELLIGGGLNYIGNSSPRENINPAPAVGTILDVKKPVGLNSKSTYINPTIMINDYGQITSITNGSSGGGGAPTDATYVLWDANTNLPNAKIMPSESGLIKIDRVTTQSIIRAEPSLNGRDGDYYGPNSPTLIQDTGASGSLIIGQETADLTLSNPDGNVGIGYKVFAANPSGTGNTAIGKESLTTITEGNKSTAVGYHALNMFSTANSFTDDYDTKGGNTAVGWSALEQLQTGRANVAVGFKTLQTGTTTEQCTAVGYASQSSVTTGTFNTSLGTFALQNNTEGSYNVALGNNALQKNTTGGTNIAIGMDSLTSNTTGNSNTAVGYNTLNKNIEGFYNTAFGWQSLTNNTNGQYNTAIGYQSMTRSSGGSDNIAIGSNTLSQAATSSNIAIGKDSMASAISGDDNVAIGRQTLQRNNNSGAAGNVAIGAEALKSNTTGQANVAVGPGAMAGNKGGQDNIAIGRTTLALNETGRENIALGTEALAQSINPTGNIAIGTTSMAASTSGNFNIAIGPDSFNQCGGNNSIAIGPSALEKCTAAQDTVAIGYQVGANSGAVTSSVLLGANINSGNNISNCTLIGTSSNCPNDLQNATAIGANTAVSVSNAVVLGSNCNIGINKTAPRYTLDLANVSDPNDSNSMKCAIALQNTENVPSWSTITGGVLYVENNDLYYANSARIEKLNKDNDQGVATLVGGEVVITTEAVKTTSFIFLSYKDAGLAASILSAPSDSITDGSFKIKSGNSLDTSTVFWRVVNN